MKKAFLLILILMVSVISTACINNFAVQELNNKAQEFLNKGDYENAISRLKSSIDLDDTIFESHYNLGIAYTHAQQYPEAIDEFEKAIKLNSSRDVAYYSIAVAYENYAKDIINPPVKEEDTENEEVSIPEKKDLTAEDKQQICDLFSKAVDSYEKYLEITTDNSQTDAVKAKISYLQEEITKYSQE